MRRQKHGFTIIPGSKPAPLVTRRDILFGVKIFALTFAVSMMIPFWSTLQSIILPISVPAVIETMAALRPDVHIIDGDTYEDRRSGVRYRLVNVDTPETGNRAQCAAERRHAEKATAAANDLISDAGKVEFLPTGNKDRYGRTLARVEVDGRDLGAALVARKLARPWRGRREPWCGHRGELLL